MLYSDPARSVEKILYDGAALRCRRSPRRDTACLAPHMEGQRSGPAISMFDRGHGLIRSSFIADGHHRYETALNYSKEHAPAEVESSTAGLPQPAYP